MQEEKKRRPTRNATRIVEHSAPVLVYFSQVFGRPRTCQVFSKFY